MACETQNLEMKCKQDEVITVLKANYGRTSQSVCVEGDISVDKCVNIKSKNIVSRICSGKQQCKILAGNTVFGDPCEGIFKYLDVEFSCARVAKKGKAWK